MSLKIIADSKNELPEHLQSQAEEVDGKFQVDGDGIVKKNKELLKDNSTLRAKNEELTADADTAKADRDEWKGKAKIPNGSKIVTDEIAELGEAAKSAEIGKDEMPTLKGAKADLQKRIDSFENEKVIAEVAATKGLNKRFVLAAQDKGWKFEKTTEKVGDKDVEDFVVLNADGTKPKIDDFLKTDAYAKEFADTFKSEKGRQGNTFDPSPAGVAGTEEADKAASAAMAQSFKNTF